MMEHHATPRFWESYAKLPIKMQQLADANFNLLKQDPFHPSLHFKKVGKFWSVRVGLKYRALGVRSETSIIWFWIGSHAEYDKLLA